MDSKSNLKFSFFAALLFLVSLFLYLIVPQYVLVAFLVYVFVVMLLIIVVVGLKWLIDVLDDREHQRQLQRERVRLELERQELELLSQRRTYRRGCMLYHYHRKHSRRPSK